jgi:8-oxo-dGTP pyrophosphatase MutT (NUDIX family)
MGAARNPQHALPLQVAAVCYRRRGPSVEFLLVNTNGGGKWTFPKGDPESSLSHGQAAEREAWEEAGVRGTIESRHFCLYIHSKGVFWFSPEETKKILAKGREVKYARELQAVVDRAMEKIATSQAAAAQ